MLPFDHTDAAGDVTYLQPRSKVSHIVGAPRNSVEKKSYPHLLAAVNLICGPSARALWWHALCKQAQRKSANFRLTSRRKPRRMNRIWRNDASEVASVGELSTGEIAPQGVGNFSAKRFEVLKLRKNAYRRAHQVPLEKIKQRLIYQIWKAGVMLYERSK